MYAFKIFASTLIVMMIVLLFYTAFKSDKSGKVISVMMAIIYALGIVAIWG